MYRNKIEIAGNIAKKGEYKATEKSGVLSFTLAINEKRGTEEKATFLNCVCFGKTAEFVAERLAVGCNVFVDGRLQNRDYEDKDGRAVYVTEIVVEELSVITWPKAE